MFTYTAPKKLEDGRYYIKASHDNGKPIFVQLNNVILASKFSEADNVIVELADTNSVTSLDDGNKVAAKENSQEWFGKTMSEKTIDAGYVSGLNGNTFTVQKVRSKGKVLTKAFDHTKEPIDTADLDEGAKCDVVVEFSGLMFMKKSFSPIWRIVQVRLRSPPKKHYTDEYLFEDDQEADSPSEDDEDFV